MCIRDRLTTEGGFANGNTEAPTYEEVCHNNTGHAETVRVEYDAQQMPLARLLKCYVASINPTSLNRQGEDSGSQYRTGIVYLREGDLPAIRRAVDVYKRQAPRRRRGGGPAADLAGAQVQRPAAGGRLVCRAGPAHLPGNRAGLPRPAAGLRPHRDVYKRQVR